MHPWVLRGQCSTNSRTKLEHTITLRCILPDIISIEIHTVKFSSGIRVGIMPIVQIVYWVVDPSFYQRQGSTRAPTAIPGAGSVLWINVQNLFAGLVVLNMNETPTRGSLLYRYGKLIRIISIHIECRIQSKPFPDRIENFNFRND